ncbi:MAG TPA: LamG-like jellyroll fold domain-containing protein [Mucilaginibacter sp.]|nr:LamG-like jellyroll fold domain-containing protein [Mucilaginibacter sp.]
MKTFKNILIAALLSGAVLSLVLSSCQKEFNPKSYAPPKPPPSFSGYSKSVDIEPTHLVAYWPFNGDLKDSISGTAGVSTGTSFTQGIKGQALKGAENAYVISDVPAAIKALHSFTMTVWYNNPENTNGLINPVDIVNGTYFWGAMDFFIENPPADTSANIKLHMYNTAVGSNGADLWVGDFHISHPYNSWCQMVFTYNDNTGTAIVYFNGNQVGTATSATFAPLDWSNATKMVFGTVQFETNPSLTNATGSQPWANYITGAMEHVRFYDEVLSAPQVSALYNLEKLGR